MEGGEDAESEVGFAGGGVGEFGEGGGVGVLGVGLQFAGLEV